MNDLTQSELWHLRALIQKIGWGKFMLHVSSLMAEQADKTSGEQSGNLFTCSNTLHTLNSFFQGCGHFDYRKLLDMIPEEHRAVINRNPPPEEGGK